MELEEIIEDVRNNLSEGRFKHSLGVMKRIEELANIYGVDVEKAKKVGIAHDIAKELSVEDKMRYTKENNIFVNEIERMHPGLLHGKIGADIAKKRYGFDEQMQKAILYHTTGNPQMDLLAKVLFAADKTEEGRNFPEYDLEYERKLANEDINKAIVYMIEENIKENMKKKKMIDPISIVTRNKLMI